MKAAGVDVVRWWLFPRFLADGITWAADDTPAGVGGTLTADLQAALELAAQHDVYLVLTPFSFDNFRPTADESGVNSRGIRPMVVEAGARERLLANLVVPVAQAVAASPYAARVLAWDLINEPEWAMSGPSLYGDPDFEPMNGLETVTHAQMETFLADLAEALRASSGAQVTVGRAGIKWGHAWTRLGLDFYALHYYDWVYEWFPYQDPQFAPAAYGLDDRPVVMGEFPMQGLSATGGHPARSLLELTSDLWSYGYAGALAWAYNDPGFPWDPTAMAALPALLPCETAYARRRAAADAPPAPASASAPADDAAGRAPAGPDGDEQLNADEQRYLAMRALVHRGRIAAARDAAVRFFERHDASPYAERVARLTGVRPRPRLGPRP
jgi:hypothetical protein